MNTLLEIVSKSIAGCNICLDLPTEHRGTCVVSVDSIFRLEQRARKLALQEVEEMIRVLAALGES